MHPPSSLSSAEGTKGLRIFLASISLLIFGKVMQDSQYQALVGFFNVLWQSKPARKFERCHPMRYRTHHAHDVNRLIIGQMIGIKGTERDRDVVTHQGLAFSILGIGTNRCCITFGTRLDASAIGIHQRPNGLSTGFTHHGLSQEFDLFTERQEPDFTIDIGHTRWEIMIEGWRTNAELIGELFQTERSQAPGVSKLRGALYDRCFV